MDFERARELLAAERLELECALSHRGREGDGENAGFQEPADRETSLGIEAEPSRQRHRAELSLGNLLSR
jgi:hypothetical protein